MRHILLARPTLSLAIMVSAMLVVGGRAFGQADAPGPDGKLMGLTPGQAAKDALLHQIEAIEAGQPDYDAMTPEAAQFVRREMPRVQDQIGRWGAFEALGTGHPLDSWYVYTALFVRAQVQWAINPLDSQGKITGLGFKTLYFSTVPDHHGPSPGSEGSLRRIIESLEKGLPNYGEMSRALAQLVRQQLPHTLDNISQLGPLKSVTFLAAEPNGFDKYDVVFEHGQTIWWIAPLTPDGRVGGLVFQRVPTGVSCCHIESGP